MFELCVISQPLTSWYGFAGEIFHQALELNLLEKALRCSRRSLPANPIPAKLPQTFRLDIRCFVSSFDIPLADWREDLRHYLVSWQQHP